MAPKPVEAVFFFRWDKQTSQATYHRISKSSRYTKNYLQVSGEAGEVLDIVFGRTGNQEVRLTWRWPEDGGGQTGKLRLHKGEPGSAKRVHLTWDKAGMAPKPWKLGDPLRDPVIVIPGDPGGMTDDEADAAIEKVTKSNVRPWFIAVKLEGEENELHARAYLENPPLGLERADIAQLPSGLLTAINALGSPQSGVYRPVRSAAPAPRAPKIVAAVRKALEKDPNVLLVGPPGTGKTVALEDLRELVEHADAPLTFDPDLVGGAFEEATNAGKVVSLVFHPSFAYENFVAGLVPRSEDGELRLEAQPGPLIDLAHWAAGSDRRALLLLDEFNRGSAAAIFGDTLALLDGSKRASEPGGGGTHIARPFADQEMNVPREYANAEGSVEVPPELRLPANLQIVAALNSSDRSVAPLDAALRRRFAIVRVDPDLELLADHFGVPGAAGPPALAADPEDWTAADVKALGLHLLATLNERIEFVLGDDFLLGHALLWPVGEAEDGEVRDALCAAFDQRIVQSLRLSFADQDDLLAAVLGAGLAEESGGGGGVAIWRQPPQAVEPFAQPHLAVRSVAAMPWEEAAAALLAVFQPET